MSDDIVIEKGIPLPTAKKLSRLSMAYHAMEVGDSFHLKDAHSADDRRIVSIRVWGHRQSPVRRFTARQQVDGGMRVWRIA
jgi:hypothetical protein